MKPATLCVVLDKPAGKILLGFKKRGFGEGRWNGFGGKVKESESLEQAAIRELEEEAGIVGNNLERVAELTFLFSGNVEWNQVVHVFFLQEWVGEPQESEEMKPQWFSLAEIPFSQMWPDDQYWLPKVLKGEKVKGMFEFRGDSIAACHILPM